MKTFHIRAFVPLCGLLVLAAAPAAAQDRLDRDPGYFDLSAVGSWFQDEPWLEVNIRGALLKLVAEASRYEDPELTDLLLKLKAIEVRGYELSRAQYDDIERRTSELARRLQDRGWDTLARVRERNERVDVYLKVHDGNIAGMAVMVLEPGSDDGAVFVNIVGEIDPEQIGRIGAKFNIGPLQDSVVRNRR